MNIPTTKAIETSYAGHRFRSRLEARWAVFLNTLGLAWEYEPQGYLLTPSGVAFTGEPVPYLPDFWLPRQEMWIEVKGSDADNFEGQHVDLCRSLANETGSRVLLLVGPPEPRMYHQFAPGMRETEFRAAFFQDYHPHIVTADAYWFQSVERDPETGALMFKHPDDRALRKSFGQGYVNALAAARSARFEHGERG